MTRFSLLGGGDKERAFLILRSAEGGGGRACLFLAKRKTGGGLEHKKPLGYQQHNDQR